MNDDNNPSSSENVDSDNAIPNIDDATIAPRQIGAVDDDKTVGVSQTDIESSSKKIRELGRLPEFGDYELLEEIARGGMGVVYRGRQKSLNRDVAIKMILAGEFASQDEVDRFYTEAKAAANLDHPGIVPVYEFGQHEGHHFFSMKYIDGGHLGSRLKELRDDIPKAVTVLQQVCEAVHHAHQRGILHRDLKPGNILLDENDQPHITDLGLARAVGGDSKLTRTGAVLGTPSYMPPEQAAGSADITTAADIYALGAILYEIMTGRPPFQAASPVETLMQVINEMPEKPSLSGQTDRGLELICMKCLSKEPADRYSSAATLASDLQSWLNDEPLSIRAPSLKNVTKFWLKQNFGRAAWAFLIGPVAGIVSSLSLWYSTVGRDYQFAHQAYDALPSADMPLVMGAITLPGWTEVPLMIVFAISIVFIGYVTALFVNPKNRGADLAAGTIVGLFASFTAFLFAFGPMCIQTTLDRTAMSQIEMLALSEPGTTPNEILRQYPELEEITRREQVGRLTEKLNADNFLLIPRGLWLGVFVSLIVYFVPCLYETSVAGPILRKHSKLPISLPAYLEVAFPIVTLMTLVGIAVATRILLGGIGFTMTWRIVVLLLLIAAAIVVRRLNWQVLSRVVVQFLLVGAFTLFFATDFPDVPGIARSRGVIASANRQIKKNPDRFANHVYLLEANSQMANTMVTLDRLETAGVSFEKSIRLADELAKKTYLDGFDADQSRKLQCMTRLQKVLWLVRINRLDEATSVWEQTREDFPGYPELAAVFMKIREAKTSTATR